MLDKIKIFGYNTSEIRQTTINGLSKGLVRNNRDFGEGGYFFFVISITSATMETIRVSSKNNSLYVIISTALLS